jgi:hypothetical protein
MHPGYARLYLPLLAKLGLRAAPSRQLNTARLFLSQREMKRRIAEGIILITLFESFSNPSRILLESESFRILFGSFLD